MLKIHLCDYRNAYTLVKETIAVSGAAADKIKL